MQETVQAIEGITPSMLWNFGYIMLALIAIVITIEKIPDMVWKWKDRKRKAEQTTSDAVADEISAKVMDKLEPRFDEIDEKLKSDKLRLDSHDYALNAIHRAQHDISDGFSVICYAIIAILNHEIHNGNRDEMEGALGKLHEYLTKRSIGDVAWPAAKENK